MAVIRPADNKTLCHKSSQKTKAVMLIFAHSVRAHTVLLLRRDASILFSFFFGYKTETHKIVKLLKYQLASFTQSRYPPSFQCSSEDELKYVFCPLESKSQEHYHKPPSNVVFVLLGRENREQT